MTIYSTENLIRKLDLRSFFISEFKAMSCVKNIQIEISVEYHFLDEFCTGYINYVEYLKKENII